MTAPVNNGITAPKPKMTDEELRLECVKLAVQAQVPAVTIVSTARDVYGFVKSG